MRTKGLLLAVVLLVSMAFVPCTWNGTVAEKETIEVSGFSITLTAPEVDFPDSMEFEIEVEGEAQVRLDSHGGVAAATLSRLRSEKRNVRPLNTRDLPAWRQFPVEGAMRRIFIGSLV